jgi:hypothetical protein
VRKQRGILLITALLVAVILLLVGMGLLGSQASRYDAAKQFSYTAQARQLALAGLEDARVKLEMDLNFPPEPGPGQEAFSYSETLFKGPPNDGTYTVTVDFAYANDPNSAYIAVTSVGTLGDPIKPIAQYRFRAEIDNKLGGRPAGPSGINANRFFRYTHIEDEEMP